MPGDLRHLRLRFPPTMERRPEAPGRPANKRRRHIPGRAVKAGARVMHSTLSRPARFFEAVRCLGHGSSRFASTKQPLAAYGTRPSTVTHERPLCSLSIMLGLAALEARKPNDGGEDQILVAIGGRLTRANSSNAATLSPAIAALERPSAAGPSTCRNQAVAADTKGCINPGQCRCRQASGRTRGRWESPALGTANAVFIIVEIDASSVQVGG